MITPLCLLSAEAVGAIQAWEEALAELGGLHSGPVVIGHARETGEEWATTDGTSVEACLAHYYQCRKDAKTELKNNNLKDTIYYTATTATLTAAKNIALLACAPAAAAFGFGYGICAAAAIATWAAGCAIATAAYLACLAVNEAVYNDAIAGCLATAELEGCADDIVYPV